MPDARAALLAEWTRSLRPGAELAPLAGDASFRRYFRARLPGGESLVAMDAPPPRENIRPFVAARAFLGGRASVPVVHAADEARGFLLLEDFGDQTYARALAAGADAQALDADAVRALVRVQAPPVPDNFPRYDETLLRRETALFAEWHCRRALNRPLRGAAWKTFARAEALLMAAIARMPVCFTHRDYHSRNLMRLPGGRNPGMLDFQDAVLGPAAYDLASLARDAYLPPDDRRRQMILDLYWDAARERGLRPAASPEALRRDFDILSVQRGLKVMGIFCRLAIRDGKRNYLADLPTARAHALAACDGVEELQELGKTLADLPPPDAS